MLPLFLVRSLCVLSDIWMTRLGQLNVPKMFQGLKYLEKKFATILKKKKLYTKKKKKGDIKFWYEIPLLKKLRM